MRNTKIIELKMYRQILQATKYQKQEENNTHERAVTGKPKVRVLTKKFHGRDIRVA